MPIEQRTTPYDGSEPKTTNYMINPDPTAQRQENARKTPELLTYKCNSCHVYGIPLADTASDNQGRVICPHCGARAVPSCPTCDHLHTCGQTIIEGLAYCPDCGGAVCPLCGSSDVEQISRVTGYLNAISGMNEAKQQEIKDRTRYDALTGDIVQGVR
jgi:hypothetical protein